MPIEEIASERLELVTPGTLTVAAVDGMGPNAFVTPQGTFSGFDVELVRAIADKLGLEASFEGYRFSSVLAAVRSRDVDLAAASLSITRPRLDLVNFTNSYNVSQMGLLVRRDSNIQRFEDLSSKTPVGAVLGSLQYDFIDGALGLQPVGFFNANEALLSLQRGNIDALIMPTFLADQVTTSGQLRLVAVAKDVQSLTAYPVSYESPLLLEALNSALDECVRDGTWQRLRDKWFPGQSIAPEWSPGSDAVRQVVIAPTPAG